MGVWWDIRVLFVVVVGEEISAVVVVVDVIVPVLWVRGEERDLGREEWEEWVTGTGEEEKEGKGVEAKERIG